MILTGIKLLVLGVWSLALGILSGYLYCKLLDWYRARKSR